MQARAGRTAAVLVTTLTVVVGASCSDDSGDAKAEARAFFAGGDCAALATVLDQSDLSERLGNGDDPTPELRSTATFLARARRDAPEQVRDEVVILARRYSDLADEAEEVDWAAIERGDPAATIGASRLGRHLADPRFGRAALTLSRYTAEHCRS